MTMNAILYTVAAILIIGFAVWLCWKRGWFLNSETILWARIQMFLGALWAILLATDITSLVAITPYAKYAPFILIVWGAITEAARKSRTEGGMTGSDLTPLPPKAP